MHHNEPILTQNNLDTPHLYWLHDGSIPPIESLGCNRANIGSIGLRFFADDVGVGHIGKTSKKVTKVVRYDAPPLPPLPLSPLSPLSQVTKVVRYDAPNVVRHGGVSGSSVFFFFRV